MRRVTFMVRGRERVGAVREGVVVDLRTSYAALLEKFMGRGKALRRAARLIPGDMVRFLSLGRPALEAAEEALSYAGSRRVAG